MVSDLVVRKRRDGKWYIKGVEDELMNRRQLFLLFETQNIPVHETAMMLTEFHFNPLSNEAHFGVQGEFLFVTSYLEKPV